MHLSWRPSAERDREQAIEFIATQDPITALDLLDRIETQTDMLLRQPLLGRPGRVPGTRELVISRSPFIVVYHLREAGHIEILRLLHGSRQWPPSGRAGTTSSRRG